jgi:uncharacterized protein HemX
VTGVLMIVLADWPAMGALFIGAGVGAFVWQQYARIRERRRRQHEADERRRAAAEERYRQLRDELDDL